MTLALKQFCIQKCRSGNNSEGPAENYSWVLDLCPAEWKQISKSLYAAWLFFRKLICACSMTSSSSAGVQNYCFCLEERNQNTNTRLAMATPEFTHFISFYMAITDFYVHILLINAYHMMHGCLVLLGKAYWKYISLFQYFLNYGR